MDPRSKIGRAILWAGLVAGLVGLGIHLLCVGLPIGLITARLSTP
jgi:hypothetical protein